MFVLTRVSVSDSCLSIASDCRFSSAYCWLSGVVVGSWLSGIGCRVLTVGCQMSLSMVVVWTWLSGIGCRVLAVDCRMSLSVVVVGTRLSGISCRLSAVDCRMSLSVAVVGTRLSGISCRVSAVDRCRYRALDHKVPLNIEHHSVSLSSPPNWDSPTLSPSTECVPPGTKGGEDTLACWWGGGVSQFGRLEKKPCTLSTLCSGYKLLSLFYFLLYSITSAASEPSQLENFWYTFIFFISSALSSTRTFVLIIT